MLTFWLVYFANTPIKMEKHSQEIALKNGSSLRSVSKQLVTQKLLSEPFSFNLLVRVLGKTNEIKAGVYSIEMGITTYDLINILVQGKTTQANITFIEGWTFTQMRAAINQHTDIKHTTTNFSDLEIMKKIGAEIEMPEGQFFPDTYFFAKGMSDQDIFKRAYLTMQTKLNSAWQNRSSDLPYLTPYQALIMASIVEKETGKSSERALIASVFLNRLNIGMRLQTDPSVIYGLGENFDGNLRKKTCSRILFITLIPAVAYHQRRSPCRDWPLSRQH